LRLDSNRAKEDFPKLGRVVSDKQMERMSKQ